MRTALKLVILLSLLPSCAIKKTPPVFSELPPLTREPGQQDYPLPQPAPKWVKDKVLAAYAKSYWFQIYPEMRLCMHKAGATGYFAAFGKNGHPVDARFPKRDTRWDEIIVDFDEQLQLEGFQKAIYQ